MLKWGPNSKYEFSWWCKKTKFTTGQIDSLKIKKKQQVKSIKVLNCNINAAIKLQCTYNDAIRTLFAQCTQPKYRDLSTNNTRRYWGWIPLQQYYLSLPDIGMYFSVNTMHEIKYGIGMEGCLPFHSWNLPFHSILASSIFHTEISIPFHALLETHLTSLFKSRRWHTPSYWNYVWQVQLVRNMIYHYNHNCYNVSQQQAVDEVSNTIFLPSSISVLVVLILSKNNFMIVPCFDSLIFQDNVNTRKFE